MDDFIKLRNTIYHGIDTTDFNSCIHYNSLLFEALISSEFRISEFYLSCIKLKALLDMESPLPDFTAELKTFCKKSTVYERFYLDYLHKIDGDEQRDGSPEAGVAELSRNERLLSFMGSAEKPIVLFQHLYYGDPASVGRGNSGGAATFVKNLGNALTSLHDINRVVTLVPVYDDLPESNENLTEFLGDEHLLVRVPFGLDSADPSLFIRYQHRITKSLKQFIGSLPRRPDLMHLRFLDAATLATARAAQELSIPIVVTLTPDPHRTICNSSGSIQRLSMAEGLDVLYGIYTGDILAKIADGLVGIGRNSLQNELIHYFPQLENTAEYRLKTIDEGIETQGDFINSRSHHFFTRNDIPFSLKNENLLRPVILNVGRIKAVKGQQNLVQAWGGSDIWKSYNLVLIGGNFSNPDEEEHQFLTFLERYMLQYPHLSGRLAHLPAQPNDVIRGIEKSLAATELYPFPNVYLCSSIKEEFGISILEAMHAEMVVCAPLRGGARNYVHHGVNGFLIDTSSEKSIASEFYTYFYERKIAKHQFERIRKNAGEMVNRNYSIETISGQYCEFYKEVLRETDR